MARKKKTIISGISREEMEEAMHSYAVADARQRALTAEMDGKLSAIREKYAQQLADLDTKKDEAFELLQAFATENRDEHFSKRKSMETTHGTLGFRIGNPQLKPGKPNTRTVEQVDKDKLLAERELEECRSVMEACHISVVQKETFYVEPKTEG